MELKLIPYEAVNCIPAKAVLVLAPHADDEALGCGGAILRHTANGTPVRVVIATDGALFSGSDREQYSTRRKVECKEAATVLGYGEPVFWDLPDQSLAYSEYLVDRIISEIHDADLVYAPSVLEIHPDHRALGMAAAEAIRRRGGCIRLAQYEVGNPIRPNILLDITDLVEAKHSAIQCFQSQLDKQHYDQHIAGLNAYRSYTLPKSVLAAEAFLVVAADDLRNDPFQIYQSEHNRQQKLALPLDPDNLPLVTVIVRTMNRPELMEALDSIALQTYPNIEVLVIQAAGVSPALPATCGKYPLRTIGTGKALPRSKAANLGLSSAKGDCLIFLDEDDLFLPSHVARLVEVLVRSHESRAAYTGVVVEGNGGIIDEYDEDFDPALMLIRNYLPIQAVLFRRSLLNTCKFDESLDLYEDWDFWLQVCRETLLARAPGISAIYRAGLGHSALTRINSEQLRTDALRQIWRKWVSSTPHTTIEGLLSHFRDEHRNLSQANVTIRDLRQMLDETRGELHAREAILGEQSNRLRDAISDADAYRSALESVHHSLSWRLAAPLRFARRLFRSR